MVKLLGSVLVAAGMAASGYLSLIAVFNGSLWLIGDSDWTRIVVGPIAAGAALIGTIAIPAWTVMACSKARDIFRRRSGD